MEHEILQQQGSRVTADVLEAEQIADHWFIRRGGQVRGPFPSGRIRRYLLEGHVTLEDEVSQDKKDWRLVSRVPEVVPRQFRYDDSEDEAAFEDQEKRDQRKAMLTMVLAVVLFGLALATTLWLGDPGQNGAAACDAAAAPGVRWQNCHKEGLVAPSAKLSGAHMANARLMRARLAGAELAQADMRFVDLTQADLAYAKLQQADLTGGNLRGVDLSNADLRGADLSFVDLSEARLGGALFDGARLRGAIWTDGRRCAESSVGACGVNR